MKRAGFTLAEIAVTIAIVGILLVVAMQGLQGAQVQAGNTRDIKIARELSLLLLGRLEAGLLADEIEDRMQGDFAEQEYPRFTWELVLGTEEFSEEDSEADQGRFDSWTSTDEDDDDESESTEPWVVARVKVGFPAPADRRSNVVLERWITREFIYAPEDEAEPTQ